MPEKYTFNDQEYDNIPKIPENAKELLKDENKNGTPDFVEKLLQAVETHKGIVQTDTQKFIIKGKEYHSLDQVPPKERKIIEEKFGQLEKQSDTQIFQNQMNAKNVNSFSTNNTEHNFRSTLKPSKQGDILRIIIFIATLAGICWFVYQSFFVR